MVRKNGSSVLNMLVTKISVLVCSLLLSVHALSSVIVDDFENGPIGGGSFFSTAFMTANTVTTDAAGIPAIPGKLATNSVLEAEFPAAPFVGVGHGNFDEVQNWDGFSSIQFWLFGNNNGNELTFNIVDQSSNGPREVYVNPFIDDFEGWQIISLTFDSFSLASFSAFENGMLDLDRITEWSFFAETRQGNGVIPSTYYLDDVKLVSTPSQSLLILLSVLGFVVMRKRNFIG